MSLRSFLCVVTMGIVAATNLSAVEPGKPSKTSIWVLAARAIGARDPDPTVRNPDWVAEQLLGPDELAILGNNNVALSVPKDYRVAMQDPETKARVLMVNIRTRYIDQKMLDAVKAGAQQVVILGAGFDSRAYRFRSQLKNVKLFEVDFGPTQEYKRRRALEVMGPAPTNLTYVPIDFTKQTASAALTKAGYSRTKKTFFIWEGVSMYLTEQQVRDFLHDIATHALPGSEITFDHFNPFFDPPSTEANAKLVAMLKEWGEPWIFGIPFGQEETFINSTGLKLKERISQLVTSDDAKRFITRQDGTTVGDIVFPPPGTQQRTVHWTVIATIPAAK